MPLLLLEGARDEQDVVVLTHRHQDREQEERHPPIHLQQRPAQNPVIDQHRRAQRGRPDEHWGREGRVDRECGPVLGRELRERHDVVHAQQRIRDGFGVQERSGSCSEGGLHRLVIGRVHEGDVSGSLARPALEERARLPVTVLLGDDPASAGDRARVHRRGDRRHSCDEARRRSDAVELREGDFERRRGRVPVPAVHIAGAFVAEDCVLLGR